MIRLLLVILALLPLGGCISISANDFTAAMLDHNDPELVERAMPTFMLLADGIIHDDPDDEDKLMGGARLYSSYASAFVKNPDQLLLLTARARTYAEKAVCEYRKELCDLASLPFDRFQKRLALARKRHVPMLHSYALTWAIWIQARSSDWNAVAELAKVKAIMQRVVALDEAHDHGSSHLYLGIMESLVPPALGGRPEVAKRHFDRALELSKGRDLTVKLEYARRYARMTFDRKLHDRLLQDVLATPTEAAGYTLSNTLAKREAKKLLQSADDYF